MKKIILILLCALLYDCNSRNGLPEDVICTCYIFPTSGTYGYYIEINSSGKITTLLEPSLGTNVLDLIQEDEYIDPMGDNLLDSVVLKKSLVLDSHDIKELKTVIDRIAKVGDYNPFVESSWNDHVGMVAFVNNHRYPYVPGEEKCKWHKWKWNKEEGKMPLSELFTFLTNKSPVPIKWGQGQDIPEAYTRISIQEDEDFDLFISRFYTDTLFTKERIDHNVEGYSGEDSEECYEESSKWNHKLLLLYVMDAAEAKNKEEFLTKYKKTDEDRIEEEIYIPDSDCFYFSVYKLINHKWYLCSFVVNNL